MADFFLGSNLTLATYTFSIFTPFMDLTHSVMDQTPTLGKSKDLSALFTEALQTHRTLHQLL